MILSEFKNFHKETVKIKLFDISCLYLDYYELLKKVFKLNDLFLQRSKSFKLSRGGYLVKIYLNNEEAAFFSLTKSFKKYFELGDVIKLKFKFSREDFSKSMMIANNYFIENSIAEGLFGFPNKLAIDLELLAGYKIKCFYKKKFFLILFNQIIQLPFTFHSKKIHINEDFSLKNFFLRNVNLVETSRKFLNFFKFYKICNKEKKKNEVIFFGFVTELALNNNNNGEPFITFFHPNAKDIPYENIKFEISDMSI